MRGEAAARSAGLPSRSRNAIGKLFAATALVHDLMLVTRNTAGFAGTGVTLLNPFRETT